MRCTSGAGSRTTRPSWPPSLVRRGRVAAIELDQDLAARAPENLAHLNHVAVVAADGSEHDPRPSDAIFVNAGATHPRSVWLDSLRPGGDFSSRSPSPSTPAATAAAAS